MQALEVPLRSLTAREGLFCLRFISKLPLLRSPSFRRNHSAYLLQINLSNLLILFSLIYPLTLLYEVPRSSCLCINPLLCSVFISKCKIYLKAYATLTLLFTCCQVHYFLQSIPYSYISPKMLLFLIITQVIV